MSAVVAVTGSTGFLGRRLVKSLLQEEGIHVRCLVRESSETTVLFDGLSEDQIARLSIHRGDLSDSNFTQEQFMDVSAVYHLAAALGGGTSTMFLNTVVPMRSLMASAAMAGAGRFVLVSSMGVYGTESLRNKETLDETTPIDPHPEQRDPYTFSKVRQEQVASELAQDLGLSLVIVRPGVIYGPGRSVVTSRVGIPVGPAVIQMGGSQTLPYTYVENCADGIKLAGLKSGVEGEVFNLVDDDLPTGRRIMRLMKQSGKKVRRVWVPQPALGILSRVYEWYSNWSEGQLPPVLTRYKCQAMWKPLNYSNEKAKQKLNWVPRISMEEGLKQAIAS